METGNEANTIHDVISVVLPMLYSVLGINISSCMHNNNRLTNLCISNEVELITSVGYRLQELLFSPASNSILVSLEK